MTRRYWLLKSDPDTFSWEDLEKALRKTTCWDGVRSYQARNYLRDDVKAGDGVLFYHSRSKPPAVVGTARVVRAGYPDPSQFHRESAHHDPGSDPLNPPWYAVDIRLEEGFTRSTTIDEMRRTRGLQNMVLFRKGRLSVQPVTPEEWKIIVKMGKGAGP